MPKQDVYTVEELIGKSASAAVRNALSTKVVPRVQGRDVDGSKAAREESTGNSKGPAMQLVGFRIMAVGPPCGNKTQRAVLGLAEYELAFDASCGAPQLYMSADVDFTVLL